MTPIVFQAKQKQFEIYARRLCLDLIEQYQ